MGSVLEQSVSAQSDLGSIMFQREQLEKVSNDLYF